MRRQFGWSCVAVLLALPCCRLFGARSGSKKGTSTAQTWIEFQKAIKKRYWTKICPGAGVANPFGGVARELLWCSGIAAADVVQTRDYLRRNFAWAPSAKLVAGVDEAPGRRKEFTMDSADTRRARNPNEQSLGVQSSGGLVNLLETTRGPRRYGSRRSDTTYATHTITAVESSSAFASRKTRRWPPDTACSYSNPDRNAAIFDRKLTGEPYDKYIRETCLTAAGADQLRFRFTEANKALLASGLRWKVAQNPSDTLTSYLRPAGDLKVRGELAKLSAIFLRAEW